MQYAIANLKHYRTRGIALRWRTEDEVVDGIGQDSCANQRCADHYEVDAPPPLGEFEVPFAYEEPDADGRMVAKQALVKVVLCDPCAEKLQHASRHARAAHDTPEAARAVHADRTILAAALDAPEIDLVIVERAAGRLRLLLAP